MSTLNPILSERCLKCRYLYPSGSNYLVMNCKQGAGRCTKAGKQPNGTQKFQCRGCKKYQQASYRYTACQAGTNQSIIAHVKEGCGIWNTARLMGIAKGTVLSRIKSIAKKIKRPSIEGKDLSYEVDELYSYVGNKADSLYICYAIESKTRNVIDFVIGPRTKENLKSVTQRLLELSPKKIYTDGLNIYPSLIPKGMHQAGKFGTLRIERSNLNLRTNLKRLARKTICFSKSVVMLEACLKIWYWR